MSCDFPAAQKLLAEYAEALAQVFCKYGTRSTWYGYASVGALYVWPLLDMRRGGVNGVAAKIRAIADETSASTRAFSAVCMAIVGVVTMDQKK